MKFIKFKLGVKPVRLINFKKIALFFLIMILSLFLIIGSSSCDEISFEKTLKENNSSASQNENISSEKQEESELGSSEDLTNIDENKDKDNEGSLADSPTDNRSEIATSDEANKEKEIFSDSILAYQNIEQNNNIMIQNPDVDFAFVYPQDKVTLSSNPNIRNETNKFFLITEIYPKSSNKLLLDFDFEYKPSVKKEKLLGLGPEITEYIVFSRDNLCDISFQRTVAFENKNFHVAITLLADKDKIISDKNLAEYFKEDNQNCSSYKKVWDFEKIDNFYNKLILGNLGGAAQSWYDTFNEILYLLQINQYKGASAGYNKIIDKRIFEENDNLNYIISASYPEFFPATSESPKSTLNKYIFEDTVLYNINEFKKIAEEQRKEFEQNTDIEEPPWKYELLIDYSITAYNDSYISMIIYMYQFLGGAHGLTLFKTFNFDLKDNRIITLRDIFSKDTFKSDADFFKFISDYCRNDLAKQQKDMGIEPDMDWINDGTDPKNEDNFANYLLTNEGLIIKFLSYQVAPGAAGDFSVLIPYN